MLHFALLLGVLEFVDVLWLKLLCMIKIKVFQMNQPFFQLFLSPPLGEQARAFVQAHHSSCHTHMRPDSRRALWPRLVRHEPLSQHTFHRNAEQLILVAARRLSRHRQRRRQLKLQHVSLVCLMIVRCLVCKRHLYANIQ